MIFRRNHKPIEDQLYSLDFLLDSFDLFFLNICRAAGKQDKKENIMQFGESSNGSGSGPWVFDEYATTW